MFIVIKKSRIVIVSLLLLGMILILSFFKFSPSAINIFNENEEIIQLTEQIIKTRNKAMLQEDLETLETLYDKSTKYGVWAYEHEVKKMKYLHNWSEKQSIEFIDISPKVVVNKVKESGDTYSVNLLCSTTYEYAYTDNPDDVTEFRIGTYHSLKLIKKDETYLIQKEWYTDPFADSLNLETIKGDSIKEFILAQQARDFSNLNKRRIAAVEYSDKYLGAAGEEKYGFKYNKNYRNYNPLGGDCANFASQMLFEGAQFKKTSGWNYDKGGASTAWVNANAFKNYMIYSGKGSVIAHGTYDKVYKASYKLLPGDFVAYEKKGKVTHISMVTGADSKGYSLVSCHNADRYKAPWDLGWSNKGIKFWLVRVNY